MDCRSNRYIKESVGKQYIILKILLENQRACLAEEILSKLFRGPLIRKENTQNSYLMMDKKKMTHEIFCTEDTKAHYLFKFIV